MFTALLICAFTLTGCQSSHRVETAAVIENVSVRPSRNGVCYTFYRLSSDEKPQKTEISASSFEEACEKAENGYIPHLTLAKLELMMIDKSLADSVMRPDIEYISARTYFSPIAYVALCDGEALEKIDADNRLQSDIRERLILCRKNNPDVKLDYLSIFNSCEKNSPSGFRIACINSDKELKAEPVRVFLSEDRQK